MAGTCWLPVDFHVVAQRHLAAGDLTTASMLEADRCRFEYPPITPLVLEQFQASETYRRCRVKAGGTAHAKFEAKVLGMDRKAHPPLSGLPDSHFRSFKPASTLAAFTVAEATAPVNEVRKALIEDIPAGNAPG